MIIVDVLQTTFFYTLFTDIQEESIIDIDWSGRCETPVGDDRTLRPGPTRRGSCMRYDRTSWI